MKKMSTTVSHTNCVVGTSYLKPKSRGMRIVEYKTSSVMKMSNALRRGAYGSRMRMRRAMISMPSNSASCILRLAS